MDLATRLKLITPATLMHRRLGKVYYDADCRKRDLLDETVTSMHVRVPNPAPNLVSMHLVPMKDVDAMHEAYLEVAQVASVLSDDFNKKREI
jgi:hypothetical protein